MTKLIYIGTSVLAAVVILAWSQNARVASQPNTPSVSVISQESAPAAEAATNRPLPVEQWDAF